MKQYRLTEGASIILDLIRGVSAQIVVIGHGISFFGIFNFLHEPHFPWMQNIAVLIFFLLSGFLISYSTVSKAHAGGYRYSHYFADRFSRIFTAFIPAILFVLVIDLVSQAVSEEAYGYMDAFNLKTFVGNILMLQEYPLIKHSTYKITSFGSARPFWTLAIEWWIYLSFGYLLLVIFKSQKVSIPSFLILLFLSVVPIYNLAMSTGLTVFWMFGLLVYVLSTLNILCNVHSNIKIMFFFIFCGLGIIRSYLIMNAYDAIFAFLLAIALWLIIDIYTVRKFSGRWTKIIRYNASISYTLYLIHYSILSFLKTHFGDTSNPYLLFSIGFVIANIASVLIGRYTETGLTKKVKQGFYNLIDKKRPQAA